ncbi:hypothetical protein Y032_0022g654 [Ancylostoma ceylanicum]|nr:hypothetical protein Y032_0022g654 [Ancylostoma ceylanicum]
MCLRSHGYSQKPSGILIHDAFTSFHGKFDANRCSPLLHMNPVEWTTLLVICLSLATSSYASQRSLFVKPISNIKRLNLASQISGQHPRYLGVTDDEMWAMWRKAVQGAQIMDSVMETNNNPNCKFLPMGCRRGETSRLWTNRNLKPRLLTWNSLI